MDQSEKKEEIKRWLEHIGKDRYWLADQCAAKKSTMDNWFSRKDFPEWALVIIDNLMRTYGAPSIPEYKEKVFSLADIVAFEQARQKVGYDSITDFMREALRQAADRIRGEEQEEGFRTFSAREEPKAAEAASPYGGKKGEHSVLAKEDAEK